MPRGAALSPSETPPHPSRNHLSASACRAFPTGTMSRGSGRPRAPREWCSACLCAAEPATDDASTSASSACDPPPPGRCSTGAGCSRTRSNSAASRSRRSSAAAWSCPRCSRPRRAGSRSPRCATSWADVGGTRRRRGRRRTAGRARRAGHRAAPQRRGGAGPRRHPRPPAPQSRRTPVRRGLSVVAGLTEECSSASDSRPRIRGHPERVGGVPRRRGDVRPPPRLQGAVGVIASTITGLVLLGVLPRDRVARAADRAAHPLRPAAPRAHPDCDRRGAAQALASAALECEAGAHG